jgi:hypothetical protein
MQRHTDLVWSIKNSFLDYVQNMPDGVVAVRGGAYRTDRGFHFPRKVNNEGLDFLGSVHFTGHQGLLAVTVASPRFRPRLDGWTLQIEDSFDAGGWLDFVDVDALSAPGTGSPTTPRLLEGGVDLFFDQYPLGTAMDPLYIVDNVEMITG